VTGLVITDSAGGGTGAAGRRYLPNDVREVMIVSNPEVDQLKPRVRGLMVPGTANPVILFRIQEKRMHRPAATRTNSLVDLLAAANQMRWPRISFHGPASSN
jgi:hypothetical protein